MGPPAPEKPGASEEANKTAVAIAERLNDELTVQDLSPNGLAGRAGATWRTVNNATTGTPVRLATTLKLARALGVNLRWLLYGEEPRYPKPEYGGERRREETDPEARDAAEEASVGLALGSAVGEQPSRADVESVSGGTAVAAVKIAGNSEEPEETRLHIRVSLPGAIFDASGQGRVVLEAYDAWLKAVK